MGYPQRLLSEGERIDLQLRPHWKALVLPVIALILTVGIGAFLAAVAPSHGTGAEASYIAIGVVALVLIVWFTLRPWIEWMNTNYVITNRRLIIRLGLIHRVGRDIPLEKVNDVSFRHDSLLDRMLGCGTLVVESAGEHGQVELDDIPHVEETQREMATLISGEPAPQTRKN
ncbi:PH domain-containing protein [Actinocrinis puniceicyclus]|uniref:PH domain-containing protein n=1 Tax=Actinocrinis puniceicyclus TaxID=977794 RepID=A0A8J7WKH1_9ACTN|nr:PH domain-containing protein [Actinocrinis puniceicyclus]MBS2961782.1 PH domain-containing protein [Actinocrinis puniceicyclus]